MTISVSIISKWVRRRVVGAGVLMAAAVMLLAPVMAISPQQCAVLCAGAASGTLTLSSQYPAGATPITVSATGTTGAVIGTLPGVPGKTTYLCGYTIDADATAATVVNASVSGLVTGSMVRRQNVGAVATGTFTTGQTFPLCLPASAQNTNVSVASGSAGTGGVTFVVVWGYQQ